MNRANRTGLGEKRRLIGFLAAIIACGSGGASVLAFFAARDAIRASIEGQALPAAADSVYAQLRTDLVQPVFVSSMMANDTFLHDWIDSGERDLGAMRRYLGEIRKRYGAFTSFLVSDRSKRYYTEDGVLKVVRPEEPRDVWYYRVARMGKPYELNVDPDLAHDDTLTIFINYRILDSEGRFLGAAGIGLTVETLRGMIERFAHEFETSIYFVDSKGAIVAGSPHGLARAPELVGDDQSLARAAAEALASEGGPFRYVRDGEVVLLRALWLPELSWWLFAERPEGASVRGARLALYLNLGLCAFVLGAVLVAAGLTVDRFQTRLERSASHDPLTGTLNRLAFASVADHAIKAARRSGETISAMLFDVDDFKRVNDELGHGAGDEVLVRVASSARGSLRESDLLCRWGGEEFLVLLRGCDTATASAIAEKLRASIASGTAGSTPAGVTVSAGVAELGPEESFESLVERADRGLLGAKRGGKDRTVAAPPPRRGNPTMG